MAAVYNPSSSLHHNYHQSRYQQSAFADSSYPTSALSHHQSLPTNSTNTGYHQSTSTTGMWDRTDVFPGLVTSDDICSAPHQSTTQASPSALLGSTQYSSGTTVGDHAGISNDHLDYTFALPSPFEYDAPSMVPHWSTSTSSSGTIASSSSSSSSTTGTSSLPSVALSLKREESLGKAIGFESTLPEIDAAPIMSYTAPLQFEVAPPVVTSPSAQSTATDFSFNFDFNFNDAPTSSVPNILPKMEDSAVKIEEEPDASSVEDVDAASDVWSPNSPSTSSSSSDRKSVV